MNISDKALSFAMRAHYGQVRKSEKDKPMVIHPMIVGDLLKYYGYDDNVVAAGYLHDVVEDTKYTIDDISRLFGGDISSLVLTASEPDKNESWENRKKHTIKITKDLPERNKAVICADKIANLEDMFNVFKKTGTEDFSCFKRGKEDQKWYYENVFNSISNDFDSPMLIRLYEDIQKVFYGYENVYIKNRVFAGNEEEYNRLTKISAYRDELAKLKNILGDSKPYVIEFTGTPRTGKTPMINVFTDFFKKGGFKVKVMEEFISSSKYKTEFIPDNKSLSVVEKNLLIASTIESNIVANLADGDDIIITDRGMFDRLVWLNILVNKGIFSEKAFLDFSDDYLADLEYLVNCVVVSYSTPLTAVQRDYHQYITLDQRKHNTEEYINDYNTALNQCYYLINGMKTFIDTTNLNNRESTLRVAETLLPSMRDEYIKKLKLYIDDKKD